MVQIRNNVNIHIFLTPFINESRVLKETRSILQSTPISKIIIVGMQGEGLALHEDIDEVRHIWRVPIRSQKLPKILIVQIVKYLEWMLRILMKFGQYKSPIVQCHNLPALPIGIIMKWLSGAKIIYDAHELETESNGLKGLRKYIAKIIERLLIRHVDEVIVVSESIARWYSASYGIRRPAVVRNIPEQSSITTEPNMIMREKCGLNDTDILFIYQGAISPGRGIQLMLEVFAKLKADKHIVFMGYGPLVDLVQEYESKFSNIHYHPAVAPSEVLRYTSGSDAGIFVPENTCLSYYYCLPNKVFEYLLGGLPIIVANYPEMASIVAEGGCGWVTNVNEESLFQLLNEINRSDLRDKRMYSRQMMNKFSWAKEERPLIKAYASLFEMSPAVT